MGIPPLIRLFVVLCAFTAPSRALVDLDDALEVLQLGKEVGQQIFRSWDLVSKNLNTDDGVELPIMHRMERKIIGQIGEVSRQITKLDHKIDRSTKVTISTLLKKIPQNTRLELRLNELADLIGRVSNSERQMKGYVEYREFIEKSTLENFATWVVSHDPGAIGGLLERIHTLASTDDASLLDRGVLNLILLHMKDSNSDLCDLQQSPNQLIYNMYNTICLTEIKGYAMMQFSWLLLKIYEKGNFTQEANLMRARYNERSSLLVASIKSALADASREMWRCDPLYHEPGETYTEISKLLQGYVENEVDMNSDESCKENCAHYTLAQNHGCFKEQYCSKQSRCTGRILNCQYIDSDMSICPANPSTGRRYEWIEYENGRRLGPQGGCDRGSTKVDSWWRWNLYHCSYCLCLCEESDGDRYFNLRTVLANTSQNKVITGLRFVKKNKIIHLQISEAVLLPRASIDQTSNHWRPVENLNILNRSLVRDVDYHMLTYEKRGIDLDDLPGLDGHILTGVRFSLLGPHIHFEARVTPFNYTTGALREEKSIWLSNDNTDGALIAPRTPLLLSYPDVPTRSHTQSIPDSHSDQYIEFTHTDLDADAAQTTVPFIDIQPVIPSTVVPLTGAGIYHKGNKGYGGFIAPKIFTYDFSKHLQAEFPKELEMLTTSEDEFVPLMIVN